MTVFLGACSTSTQLGLSEAGDAGIASELERAGRAAEKAGNIQLAQKAYQKAAERSSSPDVKVAYARTLLKSSQLDEAQASFQSVLQTHPDNTEAHIGLNQSLLAKGDYTRALSGFNGLLTKGVTDRRVLLGSGIALDGLKRHEDARGKYNQLLKRSQNDLSALNNLGLSYALSGDPDKAIEILKATLQNQKAGARTRQNLALAYALKNQLSKAREVAAIDLSNKAVEANISALQTVQKTR